MEREKKRNSRIFVYLAIFSFVAIFSLSFVFAANPVGPDQTDFISNTTKVATSAQMVNISGGYIANMNLTATVQNSKWKAFIGEVIGSFTLDDATGSTIYDWTLSVVTGRVYATRASGSVNWSGIDCANLSHLESENSLLSHSGVDDNITATFDDTTHSLFYVGSNLISSNSCPTLNTYQNNASQDSVFEEMALYDGDITQNMVYASILEEDVAGYNGEDYDFQIIVPENGTLGFSGATAYYLYVELD